MHTQASRNNSHLLSCPLTRDRSTNAPPFHPGNAALGQSEDPNGLSEPFIGRDTSLTRGHEQALASAPFPSFLLCGRAELPWGGQICALLGARTSTASTTSVHTGPLSVSRGHRLPACRHILTYRQRVLLEPFPRCSRICPAFKESSPPDPCLRYSARDRRNLVWDF